MGALNNLGGYVILALTLIVGALQALVTVSDWVRADPPASVRRSAAGAKKDPWGCGSITQEPEQDAA